MGCARLASRRALVKRIGWRSGARRLVDGSRYSLERPLEVERRHRSATPEQVRRQRGRECPDGVRKATRWAAVISGIEGRRFGAAPVFTPFTRSTVLERLPISRSCHPKGRQRRDRESAQKEHRSYTPAWPWAREDHHGETIMHPYYCRISENQFENGGRLIPCARGDSSYDGL